LVPGPVAVNVREPEKDLLEHLLDGGRVEPVERDESVQIAAANGTMRTALSGPSK
jgi:uncharacterized protein YjhX (UPF0386 family)